MGAKKIKVLFVITKSNFGGAQRYVYELATSLPAADYEVVVACGGKGILTEKLHEHGIRVYEVKNFERDIHIVKELRAFRELYVIIRAEHPDIVHINSSKAGVIGTIVARIAHVPRILFTAHGWPFFEKRNILWKSMAWILSWVTTALAHQVITVSSYDRTRARLWGLSRKLITIHTAVPQFSCLPQKDARDTLFPEHIQKAHLHDIWVVSTGEHTQNKNLFFLLNAVGAYNMQATRKLFLTLIGDGEDRQALERCVAEHHLRDFVHFTGFIDNARAYLHAFDILVLPSHKEGMPYGLLEAGHAGLFVIASNVGGIPEIITDHKNGLLIHPHTPPSLTSAFAFYETHPNEVDSYKNALRAHIRTHFNQKDMVAATSALYERDTLNQ